MGFSLFDAKLADTDLEIFDDAYTPDEKWNVGGAVREQCIMACLLRNSDTVDHLLSLHCMFDGSTYQGLWAKITIPAGAGCGVVPIMDLYAEISPLPNGLIVWGSRYSLAISLAATPATGKEVTVLTTLGTFC